MEADNPSGKSAPSDHSNYQNIEEYDKHEQKNGTKTPSTLSQKSFSSVSLEEEEEISEKSQLVKGRFDLDRFGRMSRAPAQPAADYKETQLPTHRNYGTATTHRSRNPTVIENTASEISQAREYSPYTRMKCVVGMLLFTLFCIDINLLITNIKRFNSEKTDFLHSDSRLDIMIIILIITLQVVVGMFLVLTSPYVRSGKNERKIRQQDENDEFVSMSVFFISALNISLILMNCFQN